MNVFLIAAASANDVIGRDHKLPWKLPADLKRFKKLTMNHPVVMGRKTYESIGRALPGRTNIVVTRKAEYQPKNCEVAHSMEEALEMCRNKNADRVFIIGGASLYQQALPYAKRIYLTKIDADFSGDAHFPPLDPSLWQKIEEDPHPPDANNPYPYRFLTFEKKTASETSGVKAFHEVIPRLYMGIVKMSAIERGRGSYRMPRAVGQTLPAVQEKGRGLSEHGTYRPPSQTGPVAFKPRNSSPFPHGYWDHL